MTIRDVLRMARESYKTLEHDPRFAAVKLAMIREAQLEMFQNALLTAQQLEDEQRGQSNELLARYSGPVYVLTFRPADRYPLIEWEELREGSKGRRGFRINESYPIIRHLASPQNLMEWQHVDAIGRDLRMGFSSRVVISNCLQAVKSYLPWLEGKGTGSNRMWRVNAAKVEFLDE